MTEFEILSALADNGGSMEWIALLNRCAPPNEADELLRYLHQIGIVSGTFQTNSTVTLLPAGRAYLAQLQLKQQSDQREQQRDERERQRDERENLRYQREVMRDRREVLRDERLLRHNRLTIIIAAASALIALAALFVSLG